MSSATPACRRGMDDPRLVQWRWLSGDHVVEQHVHNVDVVNWVLKTHPIKASAMGSRHRRKQGDQYDFFCADLIYPARFTFTASAGRSPTSRPM